jgi:cation/acetate symporter
MSMSEAVYARIRANPKFVQLVERRGRLAWTLAAVVFVLFYALVLTIAFAPGVIGSRVMEGSTLSVGIAAGLFQFVFFWVLTAVYVGKANSDFDAMTAEVVADAVAAEVASNRDAPPAAPAVERVKEASGAAR